MPPHGAMPRLRLCGVARPRRLPSTFWSPTAPLPTAGPASAAAATPAAPSGAGAPAHQNGAKVGAVPRWAQGGTAAHGLGLGPSRAEGEASWRVTNGGGRGGGGGGASDDASGGGRGGDQAGRGGGGRGIGGSGHGGSSREESGVSGGGGSGGREVVWDEAEQPCSPCAACSPPLTVHVGVEPTGPEGSAAAARSTWP